MWFDEITLIKELYKEDEIGNQIRDEVRTTVFCDKKSVTRSEFYNASTTGMKPSIVFVVHLYEYNDEVKIEYEGQVYNVIRTYIKNMDEVELTCERVISNV